MLGLLPEARAEEILAGYRTELEAKGFRFGVLTGELSVRPGAHGYQDAQAATRGDLTGIPLAVAAGPVPLPVPGGGRIELNLSWATLTPGGARLRFVGTTPGDVSPPQTDRLPYRMVFSQDQGGQGLADKIVSGLSVTDDLGRGYRLQPDGWQSGPRGAGLPGRRYEGEILAEPEPAAGQSGPDAAVSWLEFAADAGAGRPGGHARGRRGADRSGRAAVADPGGVLPGRAFPGDVDVDRHGRPLGGTRHRGDRRRGGRRAAVGRDAATRQCAAVRRHDARDGAWLAGAGEVSLGTSGVRPGARRRAGPGGPGRHVAAAAGHGRDREHRRTG